MLMRTRNDDATAGAPLAQVRRLFDVLPTGACLCAADGRVTHFTLPAAELWGRTPDLTTEAPRWCGAWRLYDEAGRPMPHDASWLARAVADGIPYHGRRLQIERPDGERRHAVSYASPVLDEAGNVVGGLNLLVDVTDQERAAAAERDRLRVRGEQLVALACDIRASLTPLRRSLRGTRVADGALDERLREVTRLVDRVLNLEVDAD